MGFQSLYAYEDKSTNSKALLSAEILHFQIQVKLFKSIEKCMSIYNTKLVS
jgi:hypothetical protein